MYAIVSELTYKWAINLSKELGQELAPTINVIEGYRIRYINEAIIRRLNRCTSEAEKQQVINNIPKLTKSVLVDDYKRIVNIAEQSPELLKAIAVAITATKQSNDVNEYAQLLALLEVDGLELTEEDVEGLTAIVELSDATVAYRRPVTSALRQTLEAIKVALDKLATNIEKVLATRIHIVRNAIFGSIMDV